MALFADLASAQVTGPNPVVCSTNVGITPSLRAEGYTEQTGDITLTCTGGAPLVPGAPIPQIDITVFLNTAVTSRLLPVANVNNNISEALLLIDEPGSGLAGYGPSLAQKVCTTPATGCLQYVGNQDDLTLGTAVDACITPGTTSCATTSSVFGANVFQGIVSGNSVTWFGIPVLSPGNQGVSRVYRFTNIRANATSISGSGGSAGSTPVLASFSISGAASLVISNPAPTVGFVLGGLSASASGATSFPQSFSQTRASTNTLSFGEGFGTAFKTRVSAQNSNTSFAGQGFPLASGNTQNVPGGIYRSESNFILGGMADGGTAGLADFGTRLKATFNNVPAGVRLFVSTANVFNDGSPIPPPAPPGGSAANSGTNGYALLVSAESASDGTGGPGVFPGITPTANAPGSSGSVPVAEIPVVNGSATAVWEVVNTNPNAQETLRFGVYSTFTSNVAQNSPRPGTATVNLSFAPTPPAFSASSGAAASSSLTIPRFIADSNPARNVLVITPAALGISTSALPSGVALSAYAFTLTAFGGVPLYSWSVTGLPPGLSVNAQTGVIAGVPGISGAFAVRATVTDSLGATASASYTLNVSPPLAPALQIVTPSPLPPGVVGVRYVVAFGASGSDSVTFALVGGAVPDGLVFTSNGFLTGTPAVPGQFSFTVRVTDQSGNTASKAFSLLIQPAPLTISGTVPPTADLGSPLSISLTAAGGVPPYRYSIVGSLPTGTSFTNGVISGTPTVQGNFSFRITVSDSAETVASRDFSITVAPPALALPGSALPDGQVGVSYSARVVATGGVPPITYSGTGLPDGLSLSTAGAVAGTPTVDGQFSFSVTATDSAGANVTGSVRITITPPKLTVSSTGLPDGAVNAAYSIVLTATGGVKPHTWTATGLPDGLSVAASGAVSGTPKTAGKFDVVVTVKDAVGSSVSATLSVTIAPPLAITGTPLPNGTVGSAYSTTFARTGGVAPFTFSASGLPAGLSISTGGMLSGTPATPGTVNFTVTVRDATGTSVSQGFQITIGLPAAPPLSFIGISDTSPAATQPRLKVSLGASFPVDVVVTLVLSLNPDVDPSVQFSSGGRTARIVIPAGALEGSTDVGVQTGTVAGTIVITAQLQAMGVDVTPSPAPRRTIQINPAPPVPVTVNATRNATGFNVVITGFVTSREITQVLYQFTGASGGNLQTTQLTVPVDTLFSQWFAGSASAAFGSQFTLTQPFIVQGTSQAIVSVTVTMVNRVGSSAPPVTANLN